MRTCASAVKQPVNDEVSKISADMTAACDSDRAAGDGVVEQSMLATEWLAQRSAGPVYDRGWDKSDVAVLDEDFPAGVVHVPMVGFAEDAISTLISPSSIQ
jgi:hypothetical protein